MGRIGQIEGDVHAWADAKLLKADGGAISERFQLRVGNPLVHELQRRKRAEALSRRVEDALHRAKFDRRVPARAGRIGLQPWPRVHWFLSFPALHHKLATAPLASDIEQVIVHCRCGLGIEADLGAKGVALVAEHQPLVLRHSREDRPARTAEPTARPAASALRLPPRSQSPSRQASPKTSGCSRPKARSGGRASARSAPPWWRRTSSAAP